MCVNMETHDDILFSKSLILKVIDCLKPCKRLWDYVNWVSHLGDCPIIEMDAFLPKAIYTDWIFIAYALCMTNIIFSETLTLHRLIRNKATCVLMDRNDCSGGHCILSFLCWHVEIVIELVNFWQIINHCVRDVLW